MSHRRRWPGTVAVWQVWLAARDAVRAGAILTALGELPVTLTKPGSDRATLALYVPARRRMTDVTRAFRHRFNGSCRIRRQLLRDWQRRWRRSLRVRRLTRRLVLCPASHSYRAAAGERLIRLDPGLAFGSGLHATTRFALRMLDRVGAHCASFLDVGTGSGILTIAACRLGARRQPMPEERIGDAAQRRAACGSAQRDPVSMS